MKLNIFNLFYIFLFVIFTIPFYLKKKLIQIIEIPFKHLFLYVFIFFGFASLAHAELYSTVYLNTGSGGTGNRTCMEELEDSDGNSGSFYPNFTIYYGDGYCDETDSMFLKIDCRANKFNESEIVSTTRNICLQDPPPCEEDTVPPSSPWTPIIFNYEPNEENKVVYPFSMDDFCTILGDPSRDNLPPQYKRDLISCYLEPCATVTNYIPYGQLDLTYQPDEDADGDGIPNQCDPDNDRYLDYDCDGNGQLNIAYPALLSVNADIPDLDDVTAFYYEDGSKQICSTELGSCATYNKDGLRLPNIPIDHDNDPLTHPIMYSTLEDIQTNRHIVVGGLALSALAGGVAVVGGTLAGVTGGTLLSGEMVATLGTTSLVSGLYATGQAFTGYTPYTENNLENNNLESSEQAIKINLDSWDFSTPSEDVEQSVDADSNEVLTTRNSNNEEVQITTKPDTIEVERTANDGVVTTTIIPKDTLTTPTSSNDFTQANNLNEFEYEVSIKQPDTINNDGTYKTGQVVTSSNTYNASTSSTAQTSTTTTDSTNTSSATNSSSKSTSTTTNADSTTSTTQQDYAPITNRLTQLINQNTLQNASIKEMKEKSKAQLQEIINNTQASETSLASIDSHVREQTRDLQGIVNNTDELVEGQREILEGDTDDKGIAEAINAMSSEFETFNTNIVDSFENVKTQFEEVQTSLDEGFQNNLPTSAVTTCPFDNVIEGSGITVPVNIDVCKVVAPFYSTLYFIFYIVFFGGFLTSIFYILIQARTL